MIIYENDIKIESSETRRVDSMNEFHVYIMYTSDRTREKWSVSRSVFLFPSFFHGQRSNGSVTFVSVHGMCKNQIIISYESITLKLSNAVLSRSCGHEWKLKIINALLSIDIHIGTNTNESYGPCLKISMVYKNLFGIRRENFCRSRGTERSPEIYPLVTHLCVKQHLFLRIKNEYRKRMWKTSSRY